MRARPPRRALYLSLRDVSWALLNSRSRRCARERALEAIALPVKEDSIHDDRIRNHRDDLQLSSTRTAQSIDLVDAPQQPRPGAAALSREDRDGVLFVRGDGSLLFRLCRRPHRRTVARSGGVGVGTLVAHEVLPGVGNLRRYRGNPLERVEQQRRAKIIGRNADPRWLSYPLAEVQLHASSTRPHALARICVPVLHAP